MSWYDLPSPSLPTPGHLRPHPPPLCSIHLHSAPSTSTLLHPPPLHSNSEAYLCNLCKLHHTHSQTNHGSILDPVMISSPGDKEGLQAGRLGLSHWAGPSVTRSA